MKCSPLLAALLLLPSACAFGSGSSDPAPGPLEWPEGEFVLMGTVQYTRATGTTKSTAAQTHEATLVIGVDGYMTLETTTGMCPTQNPQEVERQLDRGYRSFQCGGASFTVRPAGSLVRGTMSVTVPHVTREREGCIAYSNDKKTCLEYSYNYRESSRRAGAPLRVRKSG